MTGKPLTGFSSLIAILAILYSVYEIATGNLYIGVLNYIDSTTLTMIGVLWLRVVSRTRQATDLQAFVLALATTISFVYTYEAIYKYSFYVSPFVIPPPEIRDLIIQIGVSLMVLVGFAYGAYSFSKLSKVFVFMFAAAWIFWVAVGFPQIFNLNGFHLALLHLNLSYTQVYIVNRGTKFLLLMAFSFLPSSSKFEANSPH
ncbi:MAG: hypothetical protein OK422_04695 [Thaumarchaeota archaeon]|nr:hypothetical protein [Nitrososphaerota archaeon]